MRESLNVGSRRIGWWAPWKVTRPWLPRYWRGSDEWHNRAISVVIPPFGAFHLWFTNFEDNAEGHLDPLEHPRCRYCRADLA